MKRIIKSLLGFLTRQLGLSTHRNTINPENWNSSMLNIIVIVKLLNGLLCGLVFFLASMIIYLIATEHTFLEILPVSGCISLAGILFGIIGNFKSNEETTIEVGSVGIILFMGEIYGEEDNFYTTEGIFKTGVKLPYFGHLFSLIPQVTEHDNLDVMFGSVPTSDGQLMEGQATVEIETVNIFTINKVETATISKGLSGRITDKTLELLNASFGFHEIEEIIQSGNNEDGISQVKESLVAQIKKRTGEGECFRDVSVLFDGSSSNGAECYFPEAGVNLKINLIKQEPEDKSLLDAYTNINVQEAGVKAAKERAKITQIDAEAAAEASKEKGFAEAEVNKAKGFAEAEVNRVKGEKEAEIIELTLKKLDETALKDLPLEEKKQMIQVAMGNEKKETKEYQVKDAGEMAAKIAETIVKIFTS